MRYGQLRVGKYKTIDHDTLLDLHEYMFRINVGSSIGDVINALAAITFNELEDLTAEFEPPQRGVKRKASGGSSSDTDSSGE